jgi:hypothetical protein
MQALLKSVVTSITEVPKLWSMPPGGAALIFMKFLFNISLEKPNLTPSRKLYMEKI